MSDLEREIKGEEEQEEEEGEEEDPPQRSGEAVGDGSRKWERKNTGREREGRGGGAASQLSKAIGPQRTMWVYVFVGECVHRCVCSVHAHMCVCVC